MFNTNLFRIYSTHNPIILHNTDTTAYSEIFCRKNPKSIKCIIEYNAIDVFLHFKPYKRYNGISMDNAFNLLYLYLTKLTRRFLYGKRF